MKPTFRIYPLTVGLLALMMLAAACRQDATPAPESTIQGILWQWTSLTNQSTGETTTISNPES